MSAPLNSDELELFYMLCTVPYGLVDRYVHSLYTYYILDTFACVCVSLYVCMWIQSVQLVH